MKTSLPQMRDALWYGDGTKLNLYYKNEQGKMCTTSVYEVMDAYSETLLGYDIAPNENFDSQYRAYRMAVETAGSRPYEIVTDNQGGHKKGDATGFFQRLTILHRPTMPYNGQSKTIESAFGRFQAQVLHAIWYFTGQNVNAKKLKSKPNLEFIEENAYALPTLEELKIIYKECRDKWNNEEKHFATGMPHIEMYRMSENPEAQPVTEIDMMQMFWLCNPKPVTYTNYGLQIEHLHHIYFSHRLRLRILTHAIHLNVGHTGGKMLLFIIPLITAFLIYDLQLFKRRQCIGVLFYEFQIRLAFQLLGIYILSGEVPDGVQHLSLKASESALDGFGLSVVRHGRAM